MGLGVIPQNMAITAVCSCSSRWSLIHLRLRSVMGYTLCLYLVAYCEYLSIMIIYILRLLSRGG